MKFGPLISKSQAKTEALSKTSQTTPETVADKGPLKATEPPQDQKLEADSSEESLPVLPEGPVVGTVANNALPAPKKDTRLEFFSNPPKEAKPAAAASSPSVPAPAAPGDSRVMGLFSGAAASNPYVTPIIPNNPPPSLRVLPPAGPSSGVPSAPSLEGDALLRTAALNGVRHVLKLCTMHGFVSTEEAAYLMPKDAELTDRLQLEAIAHKMGTTTSAAIQKAVADDMKMPIFHKNMLRPISKGMDPEILRLFKKHRIIPLALELPGLQDQDRHGIITVGAEHPFLNELVLEICWRHQLKVLFCFIVLVQISDLLEMET